MDTAATPARVERLWLRPVQGGRPEEREHLDLVAGEGVVGDHTRGRMRHVTIVFAEDWRAACRALGREVDPGARRANVLVGGGGGTDWIGRRMRLGDVELEIRAETRPCPVMDEAAQGLQEALRPAGRGGVWGRVLVGGRLEVGAPVRAAEA